HLVLDRAREVAVGIERCAMPLLVLIAHADLLGARDVLEDPRDREATLFCGLGGGAMLDDGIHERVRGPFRPLLVERHVHHRHPFQNTHLRGREPHAVVGPHGVAEVGDQAAQRLAEDGHFGRALLQHRVAVDPHREDRHYFASVASTWTIALFENSTFTSSAILSTAFTSSTPITVPKIPPEVSTRSPFFSSFSIASSFFFCCCCGRLSSK